MTRQHSTSQRLGWMGLLLLLLTSLALSGVTYRLLHQLRMDSETARAQLLAQSVAQRVEHALAVGVPLEQLQGMQAFLEHRLKTHADIASIALLNADGKVLWQARANIANSDASNAAQANAPVAMHSRQPLASVRLELQSSDLQSFAASTAMLLVPVIILLSALAFLAARFSEAQGPLLRNFAARLGTRAILNGRFDSSFVIAQRREYDLRVQNLGHATRHVHETLVRVRRLIASLRVTEPQSSRRDRLDQLLHEAEGRDRFADNGLLQIRVVAAQAQAFWACLLVSISSMAMTMLATSDAATTPLQTWVQTWRLPLFVACAVVGALLISRTRLRPHVSLMACCIALCGLGIAWSMGWLERLAVNADLLAMPLLGGAMAGAALLACMQVQMQRGGSTIAATPHWPVAAIGAWSIALLWMAPALAAVTQSALGERLGAAALMLPALCCIVHLLQWNAPRSAWRMALGASSAQPAFRISPALSAAAATGVLAMLLDSLTWGTASIAINGMLGIGVMAGLYRPILRSRQLLVMLLLCALLWMLSQLLKDSALLHSGIACVAALAQGWVLGCMLKSNGPWHEPKAPHHLIAVTLGASAAMWLLQLSLPPISLPLAACALLGAGLWKLAHQAVGLNTAPDSPGASDAA
ncbi:hypothetical protein G7048_09290 [Diaphorobacter sp. HDW4B]|uniref:hypothetical protein n=1 Tax=Diaphorobacter sp. HDW4B TaxID=2714925 RepID=UPI00140DD9B9|nr:hypothetical protein [Diaphorobacter sp. HDW4B]QIL70530.1 hypothetical protein G7048_09290 [Diaphorobacter sp. HDW4B]